MSSGPYRKPADVEAADEEDAMREQARRNREDLVRKQQESIEKLYELQVEAEKRMAERAACDEERARWERFFAAALQGTAAALGVGALWDGAKYSASKPQAVAAVESAAHMADEAVRVADERAEERRKPPRQQKGNCEACGLRADAGHRCPP